jgi:uncharacterized protein
VNASFGYTLAFATGWVGGPHCLGMCGGLAGGFFAGYGWQRRGWSIALYHAARLSVYSVLGAAGAMLGRVLAQSGAVGKGQGLLMIGAGILVILMGLYRWGLPWRRERAAAPTVACVAPPLPAGPRIWAPLMAGTLNGFVPCSLVFSVALQAAASADPLRAALLMLAFGLGTLPLMGTVAGLGAWLGGRAHGLGAKLSGLTMVALGGWTLYEGWVFYDIMRGLAD